MYTAGTYMYIWFIVCIPCQVELYVLARSTCMVPSPLKAAGASAWHSPEYLGRRTGQDTLPPASHLGQREENRYRCVLNHWSNTSPPEVRFRIACTEATIVVIVAVVFVVVVVVVVGVVMVVVIVVATYVNRVQHYTVAHGFSGILIRYHNILYTSRSRSPLLRTFYKSSRWRLRTRGI